MLTDISCKMSFENNIYFFTILKQYKYYQPTFKIKKCSILFDLDVSNNLCYTVITV